MVYDIKGKIALVTGGATGIGLAYATHLLQNGAQVNIKTYFISFLWSFLCK